MRNAKKGNVALPFFAIYQAPILYVKEAKRKQ